MNEYWVKRLTRDEARAQRIARRHLQELNNLYKDLLDEIEKEYLKLYGKISNSEELTRTELWRFKGYQDIEKIINENAGLLYREELEAARSALTDVFNFTIGDLPEGNIKVVSNSLLEKILNSNWSGKNFSERIWENTNATMGRLKKDITDLTLLGKSPDEVIHNLKEDLKVDFYQADRLVRTEASYTFNQASLQRYADAGVDEVEVLIEDDDRVCEECKALEGKVFRLANAPFLPIHPNCRCAFAPVIKDF